MGRDLSGQQNMGEFEGAQFGRVDRDGSDEGLLGDSNILVNPIIRQTEF